MDLAVIKKIPISNPFPKQPIGDGLKVATLGLECHPPELKSRRSGGVARAAAVFAASFHFFRVHYPSLHFGSTHHFHFSLLIHQPSTRTRNETTSLIRELNRYVVISLPTEIERPPHDNEEPSTQREISS